MSRVDEMICFDKELVIRTASGMADAEEVDAVSGLFRAASEPLRAKILLALLDAEEMCVCDIAAAVGAGQSAVSRQLRTLRGHGVVTPRKAAQLVFYRLREDGAAAALLPPLLDLFARGAVACADRAVVSRLRAIPIATICAAELGLAAIDVRRAVAS